ncbi:dTDP-4-amino-4,6-dideoxygalactose transaminase [Paenibacillus sp. V4I3]|uniref:dTDP-4-amino-4,6-dideoxygalactose transaminase n=1 Tax=Paenibacillus sp. V4I3 TaxID=3042305 RepID=UPI00277DA346|nr:dTDP-4-amino-4,6-dideoxygalactose transaminase [Paenibacillus sp. V4I3]MDQ0873216.1 dTDP-4-amino-4,6-dideoxygalactose transaminase [Paenibacillus sp. V4I3]
MKIPFNRPPAVGEIEKHLQQVVESFHHSGDGQYTKKCNNWFETHFACDKVLLTTSCTHSLEMCAILSDLKGGDEVIMPSYTFVSTANAFVLRGARIVYVDIRPDTMNIDETLIEQAITERTKVIVPVHYGGVACEMDTIMRIANQYNLLVVEDAAQGVMSTYKGRALGTIGHLGCFSFHETKNYSCGEGGAILINDERFKERAEIVREKGTNRSRYFRGEIDKYSWVDVGSSYLPSEFNAAILYSQLEMAIPINEDRQRSWNLYYNLLQPLASAKYIELPTVPDECEHNAHMFYIKVQDLETRLSLHTFLMKNGITSSSHYGPLHSSLLGLQTGTMTGSDRFTTQESMRLLRLPLYYGLEEVKIRYVVEQLDVFFDRQTEKSLMVMEDRITG